MRRCNVLVALAMIAATTTAAIAQAQPGTDQGSDASGDAAPGSGAIASGSAERPTVYVAKPTNAYADRSSLSAVAFAVSPGMVLYPTAQQGPWTLVENEDGKTGWIATSKLVAHPAPHDAEQANRPADAPPPPTTSTSTPPLASTSVMDAPRLEDANAETRPPQPPAAPPIVESARAGCGPALYGEPSLFVALGSYSPTPSYLMVPSNKGSLLHRVAFGASYRHCAASGAPVLDGRIGLTGVVFTLGWSGGPHEDRRTSFGVGFEAELDRPLTLTTSIGGRIGAELSENTNLLTFGARLRFRDRAWLGVDIFHLPQPNVMPKCSDVVVPDCATTTTGVMLGFGLLGHGGTYTALGELGTVILGGLLIVVAYSAGGGVR